jgi:hypothetical protein
MPHLLESVQLGAARTPAAKTMMEERENFIATFLCGIHVVEIEGLA